MIAAGAAAGIAAALFGLFTADPAVTLQAVRIPSGQIFLTEPFDHPELKRLRRDENVDAVVAGKTTDIAKVAALAAHVKTLFPLSTPFPNYPPWDAAKILSMIRSGETGGFCAQYAIVFGQFCQSLGLHVRYVDLAAKGGRGTHFVTEVYLDDRRRWVAADAMAGGALVDAAGAPLDIMDLHARAVGREAGGAFYAPSGQAVPENDLAMFRNVRIYLRNNFLTVPVFVRHLESAVGRQWIFEPYRLRLLNRFTREMQESAPSHVTADPADFRFDPTIRPGLAKRFRTSSAAGVALEDLPPGATFRLRLPASHAVALVGSWIGDDRFQPHDSK